MPGFFDALTELGAAHERNVAAIRTAMTIPDTQAARDTLGGYLRGLSDNGVAGFRMSLALLLGSEPDPQVNQILQWIDANVDALRAGQLARVTPETLPKHGLGLQQVAVLLESWASLPGDELRAQFTATMTALDAEGRHEFSACVETLAQQAQQQLQQLEQRENNAWGESFEDRLAFMQARIATGGGGASSPAVQRQRQLVADLGQLAALARAWQPRQAPPDAVERQPDAPVPDDPAQMMAYLKARLEGEQAEMDPARAAALTDVLDGLADSIQRDEARQAREAANPGDRAAQEASLRADMAHVADIRDRMNRVRDLRRDLRRNVGLPAGSRASDLAPLWAQLTDEVAGLLNTHGLATRSSEQQTLTDLHTDMVKANARLTELAGNDEQVRRHEHDSLRPLAQAVRMFHRRGHVMVARPSWHGGATRVEPSSVVCAGSAAACVARVCRELRLEVLEPRSAGVDEATWLWRTLQRAGLAVLDLSENDPAVYYRLGQAYALGTELVLLRQRRAESPEAARLPFDIAQHVLDYADEEDLVARLPAVLDAALYGIQTRGQSSLMHKTLAYCRELAQASVGVEHAGVLLAQLEASVESPLDFRAALEQLLGRMGSSQLVLLYPRWPAHYPKAAQGSCFVVMPFAQRLVATQAMYQRLKALRPGHGGELKVFRGDEAEGEDIIGGIWRDIAAASHVVVDLTDYNLNVCLELGMAHALGRNVILIGAKGRVLPEPATGGAGKLRLFAAIEKQRVHAYGEDEASQQAICARVQRFIDNP